MTAAKMTMTKQAADSEELEQAKSRFLALLTHEMRTPLTNIMGWACEALEQPEIAPEALRIIYRNAFEQSRALNNLVEMSRICHGRLRLKPEAADLWTLAEDAVRNIHYLAEACGVTFAVEPPPGPLPVRVDKKRLHAAICNLLDNALKFSPAGGAVLLSAGNQGNAVRLAIRDSGRGIPVEQLPTLFDPFYCDSEDCPTGGLRLGLALVKTVVELHGGAVSVASPGVGCGSVFTVMLPIA